MNPSLKKVEFPLPPRLRALVLISACACGAMFLKTMDARAVGGGTEWEEANHFYQKSQYSQASDAYLSLLKNSPANPYLHFNLANCYFRDASQNSLGKAIAEYSKAYRLLPRDPDIRYNYDFALKRSGDSLVPNGVPPALHYLFYLMSESELLGLFWIGWWAALILGSAFLLTQGESRRKVLNGLWLAAFLLTLNGSWWGLRRMADIPDLGVILQPNAEARNGPGPNFTVSFNAPAGRRVSILSQKGDWVEINMYKESLRGWVPAQAVERASKI